MRITIDDKVKQQDYTPNSGTFLDSAFFSPETVLPASYLLGTSEPEEMKPISTPKTARKIEIEEPSRQSSHWIGLVASVSVGILIAFFLFPMIAFVTRSTQSYVTSSWESEINRRVGNYEQIHAKQGSASQSEELLPYNLAVSSWQELHAEMFTHSPYPNPLAKPFFGSNQSPTPFEAVVGDPYALPYPCSWFEPDAIAIRSDKNPDGTGIRKPRFSVSILEDLADFSEWDVLVSADMVGMADMMLLITPRQENSVRSAFGQNILLRDGRVFFRILPGVEAAQK